MLGEASRPYTFRITRPVRTALVLEVVVDMEGVEREPDMDQLNHEAKHWAQYFAQSVKVLTNKPPDEEELEELREKFRIEKEARQDEPKEGTLEDFDKHQRIP